MKAESNLKPNAAFEIEIHGATATIILYDNIEETSRQTDGGTETAYIFDRYTVETQARSNLAAAVENDIAAWIEHAKKAEYNTLAAQIREKRNKLLAETDKEFAFDRLGLACTEEVSTVNLLSCVKNFFEAIGKKTNGKMAQYRKALRDITLQPGFPYSVEFPQKPSED